MSSIRLLSVLRTQITGRCYGGLPVRFASDQSATALGTNEILDRLKEAKTKKLGSILDVYSEHKANFTAPLCVVALTLIDAEASARARSRRGYEVNLDSVRGAKEISRLVERAARHCRSLQPHMFGNLVILLHSFRMFNNTDVLDAVADAAPDMFAELKLSALLSILGRLQADQWAVPIADLCFNTALKRLPHDEVSVEVALGKMLSAMSARQSSFPQELFQRFLNALKEHGGSFSAESIWHFCKNSQGLTQRNSMALFECLSSNVELVAEGASTERLASIVYHYGTRACCRAGFWEKLLSAMSKKLADCSPSSLVDIAKGVSACPEINADAKEQFFNELAAAATQTMDQFEPESLVGLLSGFVAADYIEPDFLDSVAKRARRLVTVFKPWLFPELLRSFSKLGRIDSDLLAVMSDSVHDLHTVKPHDLKDLAEIFAKAYAESGFRSLKIIKLLGMQVSDRWKEIPEDDFTFICQCFDDLGYHSDIFDRHKRERLPHCSDIVHKAHLLKRLKQQQRAKSISLRHGRLHRFGKKVGVPEWDSIRWQNQVKLNY